MVDRKWICPGWKPPCQYRIDDESIMDFLRSFTGLGEASSVSLCIKYKFHLFGEGLRLAFYSLRGEWISLSHISGRWFGFGINSMEIDLLAHPWQVVHVLYVRTLCTQICIQQHYPSAGCFVFRPRADMISTFMFRAGFGNLRQVDINL